MSSDNTGESVCERMQQHFDGYLDGELPDGLNADVSDHLKGCVACAAEIKARGSLKAAVRQSVLSIEMPMELRGVIDQQLRRHSRDSLFRFTIKKWTFALAAALLVTVGVAALLQSDQAVEKLMHIGMIDHRHCTLELERWKKVVSMEEMEKSTERNALGEDFIGLIPVIKEKVGEDFDIVQGHRCTADGRRYIHVILTGNDGVIASVVISEKNGESYGGLRADVVLPSGLALYQHSKDGLDAAAFETDRYLAYVVSNLDKAANLKAAENLAPALADYLQRVGA